MYERFYSLRSNPFALTPDPDYLFLTDEHREAIAGLMYAVLARRGFSVLIGDAGTGKTTLIRSLMRRIPENRVVFSLITNPMLDAGEFLRTCVADFGLQVGDSPKDVVLAKLHDFLLETHRTGRIPVVIVDEAQRLSSILLEEIRLLTNFETDKEKLIHVVLAGQDELGTLLDRHDLRQLKQRISTRFHLRPLTADAVGAYITHRWRRCSDTPAPFTADAVAAICEFSGGIPRVINCLCENALLLGFAQDEQTLSRDIITSVAADLRLSSAPHNERPALTPPRARSHDDHFRVTAPVPVDSTERMDAAPPVRYPQKRSWRVRLGLA